MIRYSIFAMISNINGINIAPLPCEQFPSVCWHPKIVIKTQNIDMHYKTLKLY